MMDDIDMLQDAREMRRRAAASLSALRRELHDAMDDWRATGGSDRASARRRLQPLIEDTRAATLQLALAEVALAATHRACASHIWAQ